MVAPIRTRPLLARVMPLGLAGAIAIVGCSCSTPCTRPVEATPGSVAVVYCHSAEETTSCEGGPHCGG